MKINILFIIMFLFLIKPEVGFSEKSLWRKITDPIGDAIHGPPGSLEKADSAFMDNEAKLNSKTCVNVDSRKGWQDFTFGGQFSEIFQISGGWSIDIHNYPLVGASGYSGSAAEALAPYNQYKYDQRFPFGALLVGLDGQNYLWIQNFLRGVGSFKEAHIRINEADNVLGDNNGVLTVCFRR